MSEIRVDRFKAEDGISAPQFPNGIQVTGVVTATVLDTSVPILAVGANINAGAAGIVTARGADVNGNADISGDLNVDGHTNLDNVNVVGVLTATGAINASHSTFGNLQTTGITIQNTNATVLFNDTNNNPDYRVAADSGVFDIDQYNNGGSDIQVVKINTDGHIDIATNVDFNSGIDVTGNATVSGNLSVGGVLTYEDVTNIDSVGIITARAGIHNTGGNITLGDSSGTNDDRIKLGDNGDLQIFHSGSHSIIADFSGTGQLQICTDAFRLNNAANNENIIAADQDGSVSLYENNSLKFKTGVTGDYGSVQLQNGKNGWYGVSCNGQTVFMSDGNDIGLYNDVDNEWILKGTRNGEVQLRHNDSIKLQTTSSGVTVTGTLAATAVTGDGSGLTGVVAVPTGAIMAWPTESIPSGFLKCQGQAIARSTYSDLFSAIGVIYGAGNGSSTFNIPDYRGEFLRGRAEGSANDPDRGSRTNRGDGNGGDNVGTKQDYAVINHSHGNNSGGQQNHGYNNNSNNTGTFSKSGHGYYANQAHSYEIVHSMSYGTNYANVNGHVTNNEVRPRNVYVHWIIKT